MDESLYAFPPVHGSSTVSYITICIKYELYVPVRRTMNTVNTWYFYNTPLLKTATPESPSFQLNSVSEMKKYWKSIFCHTGYRVTGYRLFQSEITEVEPEDKYKDVPKLTLL